MAGHVVKVSVHADTKQFSKAFRNLGNELGLDGVVSKAKDAAKAVAAIGIAAAGAAGGVAFKGVKMAADLEQSVGAIQDVFKEGAAQMLSWSNDAAVAAGLTKNEYNELAVLIGSQLKNAGTSMEELGPKTNDLIKLGSDLSAMFGGTTADAVGALSSALKGERDPIERYGVSLKQAAIDAKAAELGFQKVGGSFDQEAQAAATLALIMEQTTDAHGKFAAEGDTLSHKIQVLKATMTNAWTDIGTYLLPVVTKAATWLGDRLPGALAAMANAWKTRAEPAIQRLVAWFQGKALPVILQLRDALVNTIIPAVRDFAAAFAEAVGPKLQAAIDFISRFKEEIAAAAITAVGLYEGFQVFNKVKDIINATKVAFNALKVAMATNPFGLIAIAVVALAAGFVFLWKNCEPFREFFTQLWEQIKTAAMTAWEWFQNTLLPQFQAWWEQIKLIFQAAWDFLMAAWETVGRPIFDAIVNVVMGLAAQWSMIWAGIQAVLSGVWEAISGVITGALDVIKGLFNVFAGIFTGDWGRVWNGIKSVFSGVWNAISGVLGGALGVIKGIISTALGIIKGLWSGGWENVKSVLSSVWNGIKTGVTTGITAVVNTIRGLPGKALSALGNIGSTLLSAGKNLIQGFLNGINSAFNRVKSRLKQLTSWLPSWKGPEDLDKRLLTPAGTFVIQGFIRGLESQYGAVKRSLGRLTASVAATPFDPLTAPTLQAGAQPAGAVVFSPTIDVKAVAPSPEVGRAISQALDSWWAINGTRTVNVR